MISKKTKISLFILSLVCICGVIYVLYPFHGIPTIYSTTVENTPFEEVVLEKDSSGLKSVSADSTATTSSSSPSSPNSNTSLPNKGKSNTQSNNNNTNTTTQSSNEDIKPVTKPSSGKELFANNFKQNYTANSRVRFTDFFNTFKNNDYISGKEFSGIYRRDPTLNKIAKGTICSFIEKNIRYITRRDNQLIITTTETSGIHTKVKIPFVEDLNINIADQASIDVGKTFTSTEKEFFKSILMPIQLNKIDIIHNGDEFPKKGYVSGNYYFIEYSKTKMAYKIR